MPNRPGILVDLVVVATYHSLVAKEVDLVVLDAIGKLVVGFDVVETVGLVPAVGKDIEGDHTANGVATSTSLAFSIHAKGDKSSRQPEIWKLLLQRLHKLRPNPMLKIIFIKIRPLLITRVPTHRTNINHAIPELHKRASHNRYLQIRNISQAELNELLVFLLAEPADEGLCGERNAHAEGAEPVLWEAVVEERGYRDGGGAELFLLLDEIGTAYVADGAFLAESVKELEHFGGGMLGGMRC